MFFFNVAMAERRIAAEYAFEDGSEKKFKISDFGLVGDVIWNRSRRAIMIPISSISSVIISVNISFNSLFDINFNFYNKN